MNICVGNVVLLFIYIDFFVSIHDHMMTEEEFSLLSNLPDVYGLDKSSEEFQEVARNFYSTLQDPHSRIKIVKVGE